ncbi:MAG: DDE-type integrase/transposase/recombinase [Gaiellales bacterium]
MAEEPERSLSQLQLYLGLAFPDERLSRSTLHRELMQHPAYAGIVRERKGSSRRLRDRFTASRPHQLWQLDGKGPFTVTLTDRTHRRVHVLSILDDYSRYVCAALIARGEDIPATVRVARTAIAKFGLPDRFQYDRGSAFDSHLFREGLAMLGTHRNFVRARSPETQGKVEAYHRVLERWFVRELSHQQVQNLEHLEELLSATIDLFYNRHRHRELERSPHAALGGQLSARRVGAEDLARAFWDRTEAKSHPKTGELRLPNGRFRVPVRYAGRRARFRYDPVEPRAVLVIDRAHELALEPFVVKRPFDAAPKEPPRGEGQLQRLLDHWRGHTRPNAAPGFGLPEVFAEISSLIGHLLPADEREARAVRTFYREFGPLDPAAFRAAIERTRRALGEGRALHVYLRHLTRLIRADRTTPNPGDDDEAQP